ncbi:MAG: hypothetical protein NVS3B10_11680 [Polyangiales bacterium]
MLVVIYALWIGSLVGVVLKLASPHRSMASWLFAALVGALGGIVGLFVGRMCGIAEHHRLACYGGVTLAAVAMVVAWAAGSRALHRSQVRKGRPTRPTIVF